MIWHWSLSQNDQRQIIAQQTQNICTTFAQRWSNIHSTNVIQRFCVYWVCLFQDLWRGPRVVANTSAVYARVRGSFPCLGTLKEAKCDREVVCSASDLKVLNFESSAWRAVSSHSSHHPQQVLLDQFSLYVHKSGLRPDSFHFICFRIWHWP